jgi:subtilisin
MSRNLSRFIRLSVLSTIVALGLIFTFILHSEFSETGATSTEASSLTGFVREKAFDSLIEEVQQTGRVKVIVGVNTAFTPEGSLSEFGKQRQREGIEDAQDDVLQKLSSFYTRNIKRFETIPFFAVEVDQAGLEMLRKDPMVTSIEPDELAAPSLAESTLLIGAPQTWAAGYTGTNWAVAILDTGVEASHPFFGGRVVSEACYSTNSGSNIISLCPGGVTESVAPGSANDCDISITGCGHGTHVAGIAAGSGDSFSGVAKGAPIIAIQVFTRFNDSTVCGSSTPCVRTYQSDYIKGLERVLALSSTMNVASANMSLGGGEFSANCDVERASIKLVVDQLRSVNISTVIASGNNGFTSAMSAPACISTAISVGSTSDVANTISSFSNSVSFLNLLAPGSGITASVPGGVFGIKGGTSMAAPHIAGAWSVLKQHTPSATVNQVLAAISATGVPIVDTRNAVIKPRLQLNDALQGMGCTYNLGSSSQSIDELGGALSVTVTTSGSNCLWKVGSNRSWATVTSATAVTGSNTVTLTVAPNPGATPRTATVLIAGIPHTITQNGVPCEYNLSGTSANFPATGGTGSVNVTTSAQCEWTSAKTTSPSAVNAQAGTLGPIPDSDEPGPQVPGLPRDVEFLVSGIAENAVTDIAVSMTAAHTWFGDLQVTLIAPNGTEHRIFGYTLSTTSGGYGTNKQLSGTYTFTDAATQNWWTATAAAPTIMPSGSYRTSNSGGAGATNPMPNTSIMSTFSSLTDVNGTWKLRLTDGANGDTGSISGASLTFSVGAEWLTITAGASGTGNGSVQYSIAPSSQQVSRSTTMTVAGQTVTITQDAAAPNGSMTGTVRFIAAANPFGVPGVTVSGTGETNVSGITGSNGVFNLSNFGAGAYTITPSKTGDLGNSITSLDAAYIAQYAVNLRTLNPGQLAAADVSGNGEVTSFDASQIARYTVNLGNSGSTGTWKFLPSSRNYSEVTAGMTDSDFDAVIMGDVTGNWTPPSSAQGLSPEEVAERISIFNLYGEEVRLILPTKGDFKPGFDTRIARAGEIVTMPINLAGFDSATVYSFDAVITYDADVLEPVFESPVEALGTLSTNLNIIVNPGEPGVLRLGAYGVTPIYGEGELIRIRFRVIGTNATESEIGFDSLIFNETDVTDKVQTGRVVVAGRRGQRAFDR